MVRGASLLLLAGLLGCGGGRTVSPPVEETLRVRFCQYDYEEFGSHRVPDSPVGGAFVTLRKHEGVAFLSLAIQVEGKVDWQVENMPVVGCGDDDEIHVSIDLGPVMEVTGEANVTSLEYAAEITDRPRRALDLSFETAPVETGRIVFQAGFVDAVLDAPGSVERLPQFQLPILELEANWACHPTFPNQEVGLWECGPGAVSNSLKFLDAGPGVNDIEDCKALTGFSGTGIDYVWADLKDAVTSLPPYDVTTKVLPGALGSAATHIDDFREVIDAIRDGKDVEVNTYGHMAAVVAAAEVFLPAGGALYVLHVAHDVLQGEPGGRIVEAVLYDPAENQYYFGTPGFFDDVQHLQFTIEWK